jgi:hypothetical protein
MHPRGLSLFPSLVAHIHARRRLSLYTRTFDLRHFEFCGERSALPSRPEFAEGGAGARFEAILESLPEMQKAGGWTAISTARAAGR